MWNCTCGRACWNLYWRSLLLVTELSDILFSANVKTSRNLQNFVKCSSVWNVRHSGICWKLYLCHLLLEYLENCRKQSNSELYFLRTGDISSLEWFFAIPNEINRPPNFDMLEMLKRQPANTWYFKYLMITYTMDPQFNEPPYKEALGITNDFLQHGVCKMFAKEPRYNEPSI